MMQIQFGKNDRFRPVQDSDGWAVQDHERNELCAGPYVTEVQAVYVSAALSADPSLSPYAPDA